MWKARSEDNKPANLNSPQPSQPASAPAVAATPSTPAPQKETPKTNDSYRTEVGHIGKSVLIRGELSGSEDLYLDGEIEGNIDLRDHSLIIGPNGRIKATVTPRDLAVHGRLEGNVNATGRVELKKSCTLIGDVSTQRIVIEDGAFFKGAIDIKESKETKTEQRKPAVSSSSMGSGSSSSLGSGATTYSASASGQGSFLEQK